MCLCWLFLLLNATFFRPCIFFRSWSKLISLGYHHRGADPGEVISWGISEMEPQQGVPEMARRMMPVLRDMVSAYKVGCWWSVGREGVRSSRTLALLVWKSSLWHLFFFCGFWWLFFPICSLRVSSLLLPTSICYRR